MTYSLVHPRSAPPKPSTRRCHVILLPHNAMARGTEKAALDKHKEKFLSLNVLEKAAPPRGEAHIACDGGVPELGEPIRCRMRCHNRPQH